jgi:hypothetical protein
LHVSISVDDAKIRHPALLSKDPIENTIKPLIAPWLVLNQVS